MDFICEKCGEETGGQDLMIVAMTQTKKEEKTWDLCYGCYDKLMKLLNPIITKFMEVE